MLVIQYREARLRSCSSVGRRNRFPRLPNMMIVASRISKIVWWRRVVLELLVTMFQKGVVEVLLVIRPGEESAVCLSNICQYLLLSDQTVDQYTLLLAMPKCPQIPQDFPVDITTSLDIPFSDEGGGANPVLHLPTLFRLSP